ncbi:MAG: hypothetical protein V1717_01400 [Candidatus Micrarchaeota archaeon]
MKEKQLQLVLYGLIGVGILAIIYLALATNALSNLQPKPSPTAPVEKPEIGVILINPPPCRPCIKLDDFAKNIKNYSGILLVQDETVEFQNASELIAKYGIKKLPTVLISGELDKLPALKTQLEALGETKEDGTIVITGIKPVYYDLEQKKFVGLLKATRIVNSTCIDCTKAFVFQGNLEESTGIRFSEESEFELNDTRAEALVEKYNITKIPSLIITGEIDAYEGLSEEWKKVGSAEEDGSLVWRSVVPPYQELPSGKVKGMATLIAIDNETCKECYEPNLHEEELARRGVLFGNSMYLNYTQAWAQKLVQKYNITFIPTVLVDAEMDEYYPYTQLKQIWEQVGSTESDGWHVFRNMSSLGSNKTFNNLTSGKTETTA